MTVLATPSKFILYQYNTQILTITGLYDIYNQNYIDSGATVTGTLCDENGNPVPECDEVTFVYVSGSQGNWQALFGDANFAPAIGTGYTLLVDVLTTANNSGHWEFLVEIQERQS